jgi:CPA2 family monovalent cation:H+ antiporter-2
MALAVASTVVLIRVLADHHTLHTVTGHIAVGWLVVEDLLTVGALVLLPTLAGGASGGQLGLALLLTVGKVVVLVVFTAVIGTRAIPRLLDGVAATSSRELFTLAVLALALGIAVGSALVFGVSMALGAFLAGIVVGRSDYSLRAASDALPMRDAFAVLFFVSTGMLLNPRHLLEAPGMIAAAMAVVLVGKPLVALVIVRIMRYPFKVALAVAVALAQIGEFSFILSAVGRELGILPPDTTNTLVAVAIVSIVLNPILFRSVPMVERWVAARPRWRALLDPAPQVAVGEGAAHRPAAAHRAVVVGYGPTGRTVARLLRENGIEPVVVELNLETVRQLRGEGVDAVYGDVAQQDTLEAAGLKNATHLILTAGMSASTEIIRVARELNPAIRVLARAPYLRDLPSLTKAGADAVFTGEGEVALALTEAILEQLGATPDQIDRERDRAHRDLFGAPQSEQA